MPYIKPEDRKRLMETDAFPETAGELNFVITTLVRQYIHNFHGPTYKLLNEVVGVLECVKLELYRRIAAPYEDEKQQQNGDVYYPL